MRAKPRFVEGTVCSVQSVSWLAWGAASYAVLTWRVRFSEILTKGVGQAGAKGVLEKAIAGSVELQHQAHLSESFAALTRA